MFNRYVKKTSVIIEAIQYKDDPMSIMHLCEFVPPDKRTKDFDICTQNDIWDPISPGDYILKDKYGNLVVMQAVDFEDEWGLIC